MANSFPSPTTPIACPQCGHLNPPTVVSAASPIFCERCSAPLAIGVSTSALSTSSASTPGVSTPGVSTPGASITNESEPSPPTSLPPTRLGDAPSTYAIIVPKAPKSPQTPDPTTSPESRSSSPQPIASSAASPPAPSATAAINAYCPNCGAPVSPNANFCGQCGTRLLVSSGQAASPVEDQAAAYATDQATNHANSSDRTPDFAPDAASDLVVEAADLDGATNQPIISSQPIITPPVTPPLAPPMPPIPDPATQVQPPPAGLQHLSSGRVVELPRSRSLLRIGKPYEGMMPDIDVSGFAYSEIISRSHAVIRIEGDQYYIEDMGSSNGTYINHQPLIPGNRHRLQVGDRIALGKGDLVVFLFFLASR